jgi:hypothetical protein
MAHHRCTSIPSVKAWFPVSSVRISSSVQADDNDENGVVMTDPSSGLTFLVDKTYQSYPCTSLSQESDEGIAQAIVPTRRTIAVSDSGDREDEPPSWIFDALKVGIEYVGQCLKLINIMEGQFCLLC